MQNVVKTESLRQAFSLIMEHLEQVAGAEVRIESEYYWSIDAGELYDPYNAPKDLTIGQLSLDFRSFSQLRDDVTGPAIPFHGQSI